MLCAAENAHCYCVYSCMKGCGTPSVHQLQFMFHVHPSNVLILYKQLFLFLLVSYISRYLLLLLCGQYALKYNSSCFRELPLIVIPNNGDCHKHAMNIALCAAENAYYHGIYLALPYTSILGTLMKLCVTQRSIQCPSQGLQTQLVDY